ncbi:hypothetical protein D6D26_08317 [Aureobasidium pullulans]|nr:hypothetical protein D6D26_08317 [Aureobasidium pullulans]
MPPKSVKHLEHNVYFITSTEFDSSKDKRGRLQMHQAFSSLAECNQFCEAKVDEFTMRYGIESPDITEAHYTDDGRFRIEIPSLNREMRVIVETTIMPLFGGVIEHNKPVAGKTPTKVRQSNNAKLQKGKAKVGKVQSSDEEEEDYLSSDEMKDEPHSPDATTTKPHKPTKVKASRLDTTVSPPEIPDVQHSASGTEDSVVTDADLLAAPSGNPDALTPCSYFVIGHHEHWSGEQIEVIIRRFGGIVLPKLPMYATDINFWVVLGKGCPPPLLRRIRQKEFNNVAPQKLLNQIRYGGRMEGDIRGFIKSGIISSEEVVRLCKQVPGKGEDETDDYEEL